MVARPGLDQAGPQPDRTRPMNAPIPPNAGNAVNVVIGSNHNNRDGAILGDGVVGVGGAVEQGAHVVSADVLGHGGSTSFPTEINTIVSHTVALTSRKMRNTRKRGILY